MTTLQERVAGERRRLRAVRQRLSAAIAQGADGNPDWVPFYEAVGDYMEASMARLHAQDVKMGNMIREKVEQVDDKVQKALGELDQRLAGNQKRLDALLAARDALREKGAAAIDRFESAAREFTDFIVRNMGHHGATSELAGRLFKPADWEFMAGITDEAMAKEVALYQRVERTTPAEVEVPVED